MDFIDSLNGSAAMIRAHVQSQLAIWQRVPWLALQADGRIGNFGTYRLAYEHGLWKIDVPGWRHRPVHVDCANGQLMVVPQRNGRNLMNSAWDSEVRDLANHLDLLNAFGVCALLFTASLAPPSHHVSEETTRDRERERQNIMARLGLQVDIYARDPRTARSPLRSVA